MLVAPADRVVVAVQQRLVAPAILLAHRHLKAAMAAHLSALARLITDAVEAAVRLLREVREHQPLAAMVAQARPPLSLVVP